MQKVVIDARMIDASGIGVYLKNLLDGLIKENSLDLVLLGNSKILHKKFSNLHSSQIIQFTAPIYSISEQLLLPFLIPHCDFFFSPHYNVPIFPIKAAKRIVTIHDVFHLVHLKNYNFFKRIFVKTVFWFATHYSNEIITVSNFSKKEILEYYPKVNSKINVIWNGLDAGQFKEGFEENSIENTKIKYNIPAEFILFVGNVKPHKNLQVLIEAFKLIQNKYNDIYLVIVGKKDGFVVDDQNLIEGVMNDPVLRDKVIFTGFVPDSALPIFYSLAKCFVFPSLYEGFGLPPLEAMACGCPVISSNAASLPEICGRAALFFDPKNINDLESKIITIIEDSTQSLNYKTKGKERAKQFCWENSIQRHINLLNING